MKLLCATDLLPKTEFAIARAGLLADQLGADLQLLHVVAARSSERVLEMEIDRTLLHLKSRVLSPSCRYRTLPQIVVRAGDAPAAIAETAQEIGAALVIVGPHRSRGLRDSLVGTTMARLLRTCQWPVLLVRREPAQSYRSVVMGLDLSKGAVQALRVAESVVAIEREFPVSIVHAFEPPYVGMLDYAGVRDHAVAGYANAWQRRETDQLHRVLERAGVDERRYEIAIEAASPLAAIRHAVNRLDPELLVVGTRGHGVMRRLLRASIAAQAVDATDCDVLIVPQPRASLRTVPAGEALARASRAA